MKFISFFIILLLQSRSIRSTAEDPTVLPTSQPTQQPSCEPTGQPSQVIKMFSHPLWLIHYCTITSTLSLGLLPSYLCIIVKFYFPFLEIFFSSTSILTDNWHLLYLSLSIVVNYAYIIHLSFSSNRHCNHRCVLQLNLLHNQAINRLCIHLINLHHSLRSNQRCVHRRSRHVNQVCIHQDNPLHSLALSHRCCQQISQRCNHQNR